MAVCVDCVEGGRRASPFSPQETMFRDFSPLSSFRRAYLIPQLVSHQRSRPFSFLDPRAFVRKGFPDGDDAETAAFANRVTNHSSLTCPFTQAYTEYLPTNSSRAVGIRLSTI